MCVRFYWVVRSGFFEERTSEDIRSGFVRFGGR